MAFFLLARKWLSSLRDGHHMATGYRHPPERRTRDDFLNIVQDLALSGKGFTLQDDCTVSEVLS